MHLVQFVRDDTIKVLNRSLFFRPWNCIFKLDNWTVSVSHLLLVDQSRLCLRDILGQVHCSFETDFYGHIMFTFNAEHFYFLHDLISSYIKEKDRSKFQSNVSLAFFSFLLAQIEDKSRQRSTGGTTAQAQNIDLPPLDDGRSDDARRFHCPDTKWKLQPTIKLLTAYGSEVEPFGADYILQKLGFRHARLTIPKWVQRGVMDPCEQSMTIVQFILVFLLPERFKERCLKQ